MIIIKYIVKILIIKVIESTSDSKEQINNNHNSKLIINDKKWNGYDKFRIDDIKID